MMLEGETGAGGDHPFMPLFLWLYKIDSNFFPTIQVMAV